ncbi:MAG TPA: serine hydrolase [Gemmataceae bacterium]|nr:serine hydrolase [Gemmataceae bacterium]
MLDPRHLIRLVLLILFLVSGNRTHAESPDTRAIDALVERALKAWHVPGVAVAIVRDGETIYLNGHGVRSVASKEKVTPDTLFPIASCTKSFTTAAMALLVDEGKMNWDDPPRKYVPYFHLSDPFVDREVTLRDLVTHRTGLRGHDMLWYRSPWTQEDIIRRIGRLPLDKPFRSTFQYQSTMFTVAGFAVAKASGMPWEDFVRKRLLNPLDMKAVYFTTNATAKIADRASPHRLNDHHKAEITELYPMTVAEPAGSMQANARDLSKWLRFQLGDGTIDGTVKSERLLSARNLKLMHTPQIMLPLDPLDREMFPDTHQMSYGLGWVIQDHSGHRILQHAGAIDGFRCHFTLVPKARLGIVLMCNLHETRMNIALSNALLAVLLKLPPRDWNAVIFEAERKNAREIEAQERVKLARRHMNAPPSRELGGFAGTYEHPAYGTVRITLKDAKLSWQWNHFSAPLVHYHYDTFILPLEIMGEPHVVFTLDAKGTVARMKVFGTLDVEFQRSNPH